MSRPQDGLQRHQLCFLLPASTPTYSAVRDETFDVIVVGADRREPERPGAGDLPCSESTSPMSFHCTEPEASRPGRAAL